MVAEASKVLMNLTASGRMQATNTLFFSRKTYFARYTWKTATNCNSTHVDQIVMLSIICYVAL